MNIIWIFLVFGHVSCATVPLDNIRRGHRLPADMKHSRAARQGWLFSWWWSNRGTTPYVWRPTLKPKDRVLQEFEGVDYDYFPAKPDKLLKIHQDCYAQFIVCLRTYTRLSPVCAWSALTYYFNDYYSPCQIELVNCVENSKRKSKNKDYVIYNGDGRRCRYYLRMGGDMMDAYFGTSAARRTLLHDNIYNATLRDN